MSRTHNLSTQFNLDCVCLKRVWFCGSAAGYISQKRLNGAYANQRMFQ